MAGKATRHGRCAYRDDALAGPHRAHGRAGSWSSRNDLAQREDWAKCLIFLVAWGGIEKSPAGRAIARSLLFVQPWGTRWGTPNWPSENRNLQLHPTDKSGRRTTLSHLRQASPSCAPGCGTGPDWSYGRDRDVEREGLPREVLDRLAASYQRIGKARFLRRSAWTRARRRGFERPCERGSTILRAITSRAIKGERLISIRSTLRQGRHRVARDQCELRPMRPFAAASILRPK
jgi:hypothetical protein